MGAGRQRRNMEEEDTMLMHRINEGKKYSDIKLSQLFKCLGKMSWPRHVTALWILKMAL